MARAQAKAVRPAGTRTIPQRGGRSGAVSGNTGRGCGQCRDGAHHLDLISHVRAPGRPAERAPGSRPRAPVHEPLDSSVEGGQGRGEGALAKVEGVMA